MKNEHVSIGRFKHTDVPPEIRKAANTRHMSLKKFTLLAWLRMAPELQEAVEREMEG